MARNKPAFKLKSRVVTNIGNIVSQSMFYCYLAHLCFCVLGLDAALANRDLNTLFPSQLVTVTGPDTLRYSG